MRVMKGTTLPTNGITFYPMICASTETSPTYNPYENICPISGSASVTVTDCGKNLADYEYRNQSPSISTGQMVTYDSWNTDFIKIDNTKQYSFETYNSTAGTYILYYDSNKSFLGYGRFNANTHYDVSNSPYYANTKYIKLRDDNASGTDPQIQLELGNESTTYEPYNGTTTTTQLGQTVYGGTLDVVSGVLTVDRAMMDLGTQSWTYQSVWASWYTDYIADVKGTNTGAEIPNFISDRFEAVPTNDGMSPQAQGYTGISSTTRGSSGCRILVKNGSTTEAPTGQLCYSLATPQTYQLTPQQIQTLLGQNNVWSDAGEVEVTYKADIQLYIGKLIGTTEDDYIADTAIPNGAVFSIGDRVFKATATIARGETIVPGTNCTETSITEQINSLYALV